MMEEGSRGGYKFGVGIPTRTSIEIFQCVGKNEIYPITRFADTIGYLGIVGDSLYMATCPTFTKLREDSTFSLYRIPFAKFIDYCIAINHETKFGQIAYHFIHTFRISPLASKIPTLEEALTLMSIQMEAPL